MTGTGARYRGQGEPKNLTSIEARIRQLAKDTGDEERRLRHRLGVAVLAEILAASISSDADERLLVKGGTALMLRFGLSGSRFSKDIDAMLRGRIDPFVERLRAQGRTPYRGWTVTVARTGTIDLPDVAVKPRRITVKMSYKGKSYSTVQLEISAEEGKAAEEFDVAEMCDLADLGFDATAVPQPVMTVRYQVAQKLHACTTSRTDGRPNDRAHDLVDLAILEGLVREQLPRVRAACLEVFAARSSTLWPPRLIPEDGWANQYAKAIEGLECVVPRTLEQAVALVEELIRSIHEATER